MRFLLIGSVLVMAARARAEEPAADARSVGLLTYADASTRHPVKTPAEWAKRRAEILKNMEAVMGPMPTITRPPLDVKYVAEEKFPTYTRRKLTFAAGPQNNRVSAYLLMPVKVANQTPAIICLHPTSKDFGKGIPAGLGGKASQHYAVHLAERGYIALAPDYVHSGGYNFDPYDNGFISATMLGIWNHRACVDFLQSLPEVDKDNIGVIGHSLGGHNSLFVAAFEPRIKAAVTCCGYCSFPTYKKGNLAGWSHAGYMPRIKTVYENKPEKMPFDFPEVLAVIAPRAVMTVAPIHDDNFDVGGAKACVAAARPVFELLGAADRLTAIYPDAAHDFPDDARAAAYAFFGRNLKRTP
jgi:dienelactone hydrolase